MPASAIYYNKYVSFLVIEILMNFNTDNDLPPTSLRKCEAVFTTDGERFLILLCLQKRNSDFTDNRNPC